MKSKANTRTKTLLFVFLLTATVTASAQVTIGSGTAPVSGALLQLKEKEGIGNNSIRGVGMPRVVLTNLKKLQPMYSYADEANKPSSTDLQAHIGLVVYNVNSCLNEAGTAEGMYVWDGTQWQYLGKKEGLSADIGRLRDERDQEEYHTREFYYIDVEGYKVSAGEWMLENLRYEPKNDITGFKDFTHTAVSSSTAKYWCYPQSTSGTYNPVQAKDNWYKPTGILYNWRAATNDENASKDRQEQVTGAIAGSNEVENTGPRGTAPHKYVQGICPEGWHLPSDREWNELERSIYNNASTFSSYTAADIFTPATWNSRWESGSTGSRGGHGLAMLPPCNLPGATNPTGGKSLSTAQGGFNALLAGTPTGISFTYGSNGFFWSSSSGNAAKALFRYVSSGYTTVYRRPSERFYLYSVRCKKNN